MNIKSTITLNNKIKMPILGLGVYQSDPGEETQQAVLDALNLGYRHVDTASYYQNEEDVGIAIKKSKIPRNEIFVTTKLKNPDHGDPRAAFEKSLRLLDTTYVDLYLIHWPVEKVRLKSWKILEEISQEGSCKAIGVSNFTIKHLKELLEHSSIVPAVNQVEFHPWLYQKELLAFCKNKGIVLEAYSPLTRGKKLDDPRLVALAKKYHKSPAQMLIRWCIQHGVVVIPKSVAQERIEENADVFDFEISVEDMEIMNGFNENLHISWNPEKVE